MTENGTHPGQVPLIKVILFCLERKIIGRALRSRFLCGRERRGGTASRREWCLTTHRSSRLLHLSTYHIIGTDIIEPTTIIFTGINIKLYRQILTLLDIELLDAILTENVKQTTLRILSRYLQDIFLSHPLIARTS